MSMKWPDWLKATLTAAKSMPPEEAKSVVSLAFAQWREELKAAGRCACGEPATHGSMCVKHSAKQRFLVEKRYERLREQAMCVACGKHPGHNGFTLCTDCRSKRKVDARAQYDMKKQAGVCVDCKADTVGGRTKCGRCQGEDRARVQERQREMRERGVCLGCGGHRDGSEVRCSSCRDKERARRNERKKMTVEKAIALVVERDSEYLVTGTKIVDAEYLEARELVMKKAV